MAQLPAQLAQPEDFNEQASECTGSYVLFCKDANTLPVIYFTAVYMIETVVVSIKENRFQETPMSQII